MALQLGARHQRWRYPLPQNRGEGHPQWILNVNYPGAKNRQLSLRPEQVPQVRKALERYRQAKKTLESISELNQYLLRLDREEWKEHEA